ncbi:tyrosine protein phosphatase [Neobacillus sp. WH10]|uniref:tyrosine-protein phosphatase n=1 Tax=Neobacillus sp. WH10 TaxID=3047873 RepID=UPI0024C14ED0|nr:CpsB/CapC family capsule biosynthesis tyrosine phosphatase [Neobacillus sp. WH10]WHY76645.1 tyrosine protein phosphatase [Neobacillus sp. WH10]
MIDIHCHILPSFDDGPKQIHDCIVMAKTAVDAGITHLFATPHHRNGFYDNSKSSILEGVLECNKRLQLENIPLTVHPGQELMIHREIFISLKNNELLTLDDKGKYLLLELPSCEVPAYTQEVVYELLLKGITPIIAHPERNWSFLENNNLLFTLVQEGALTQLTSGSIIGHFGKKVKSFSEKIIKHNLAHFVATDAHNIGTRGFCLHDAYEMITKKFGIDRTFYFRENAELLIRGQHPYIEKPIPIKRKRLGVF